MHTQVLILTAVLVILNVWPTQQYPQAPQNYTIELLRYAKAAEIKAYIDDDQEPCDNFYKFSCGNWKRFHPAKAHNTRTTHLERLQELYVRKSAQMLANQHTVDSKMDRMLKEFYHSCQNKDAIRNLGIEPILQILDFKGGWPRITSPSWYEYEYDWLHVVADMRRKLGVDIFVGMEIIPDFKDKLLHRIKVGAPKLELNSREAYVNSKYENARAEYKQNIANKLHRYFGEMSQTWADEVAAQILHVETELAKGLADNPHLTIEQTTRQRFPPELKAAYGSYIDFNRYFNLIFNQTIYMEVYETPEDYLANLLDVIKETPKLTLANYTMWRVLSEFDFEGDIKRNPNDDWCVEKILDYFPHQLETMFYRNYNNRIKLQNEVNSVWSDIKKTFRDDLQNSQMISWISLDTREKAKQKLEGMDLEFIAHDQEDVEREMDGLGDLNADQYYQNLISILQWHTQQNLAKLIEKPQPKMDVIHIPKYQLTTNKIQIPVRFLQERFFWDEAYPEALKFSTIGYILAQEMIKGFDQIGRKYDQHGYQRNWWDTISERTFDEYANCFTKQYSNYQFQGKQVNDPNLLTVVIADNGGLRIAYRAYQKWWKYVADNQLITNEALPLLSFTQNQLFFIGYAQLWCADYHDSIKTYTELPEHVRVTVALANFYEFATQFECDGGDKLNPEKRCTIY